MQVFEGIPFFKATNNTKTNNLAAASQVFPEPIFFSEYRQSTVSVFFLLFFCGQKAIEQGALTVHFQSVCSSFKTPFSREKVILLAPVWCGISFIHLRFDCQMYGTPFAHLYFDCQMCGTPFAHLYFDHQMYGTPFAHLYFWLTNVWNTICSPVLWLPVVWNTIFSFALWLPNVWNTICSPVLWLSVYGTPFIHLCFDCQFMDHYLHTCSLTAFVWKIPYTPVLWLAVGETVFVYYYFDCQGQYFIYLLGLPECGHFCTCLCFDCQGFQHRLLFSFLTVRVLNTMYTLVLWLPECGTLFYTLKVFRFLSTVV